MSEISVEHTVRDFWATRPRRRADDRKIAGVAAAISRRYAIDPVLVRVAFVVATLFGGSGVLLYLLGWLLLPAGGDEVSAAEGAFGRGRSSMSALLTIVLVLLLIPAGGVVLSGHAGGVLGLAVGLGGLLLLHRSRAGLGEIPGVPPTRAESQHTGTPENTGTPQNTGTSENTKALATPEPASVNTKTEDAERSAPPAWDPLGAAPFAWDLPEPPEHPATAEQAPSQRRTGGKITPITLGLALLTGGIALAFWPGLSAAAIAALLLGVIGLGLVVGSFLQGGRGLILVAIPLALLSWVLPGTSGSDFEVGNGRWRPVTVAQVLPNYSVTVGNGRLDLRGLQLATGQQVSTDVSVGVGQTHVLLPPNVDTQLSCQAQIGESHCLGRSGEGSPSQVTVTDYGADGPGGGTLILNVRSGVGQIHVDRES